MSTALSIQTPAIPEFAYGDQLQLLAPVVHDGLVDPRGLTCGLVRMEGGHHAVAHIHERSPIVVFVHSGRIASLVGEQMEPLLHTPGSVIWIAPGVPHVGVNLDPVEAAELLEARTDERFNADTVRRPDLDDLVAERVADLHHRYADGHLDDQLAGPTVHIVSQ